MITASFIIPLYNRPDEIVELLESFRDVRLPGDRYFTYEIIIVEDGSTLPSEEVIKAFISDLPITYLTQSNTGPSGARNHGATVAKGEWLIFLDSDTLLPPGYFEAIVGATGDSTIGLFGGPDRGEESFTPIQKGISYSMTAFLTTGGIRGEKEERSGRMDTFYPRTFNMGIRRLLFDRIGGFDTTMRYGEDLDLSMRAIECGARSVLLSDAWLYHKRRTGYKAFFRQVEHSGYARWTLEEKHPGTLKLVHTFPTLFLLFFPIFLFFVPGALLLYFIYAFLLMVDALITYKYSLVEACHAVVASFVQHVGYGWGFLRGTINHIMRGKDEQIREKK